jgi:hypothetical protein
VSLRIAGGMTSKKLSGSGNFANPISKRLSLFAAQRCQKLDPALDQFIANAHQNRLARLKGGCSPFPLDAPRSVERRIEPDTMCLHVMAYHIPNVRWVDIFNVCVPIVPAACNKIFSHFRHGFLCLSLAFNGWWINCPSGHLTYRKTDRNGREIQGFYSGARLIGTSFGCSPHILLISEVLATVCMGYNGTVC